jgi:hypothetical protein
MSKYHDGWPRIFLGPGAWSFLAQRAPAVLAQYVADPEAPGTASAVRAVFAGDPGFRERRSPPGSCRIVLAKRPPRWARACWGGRP